MTTRPGALESVVFGVDVQSGDVRGSRPSYATVVFDGETVERDVVSGRKLRRTVADREPDLLAVDNVYELAEDKDALVHFLRELPHETRLVQVTGGQDPEPLSRVANRHGVPYDADPMAEAEAAARLAAANVGTVVSAFGDTTRVKVSRGRSTGSGGWSEDRYTRRIHGAVKRRTREVESALDGAALDYEREVTEKYGGFSNAVFTVEAPPADIPVSAGRSGDTRVEIERERTDGIQFDPLVERRDHVIVGVDPGTTTAVAVVGLDGTVHATVSAREFDTASVTEWIVEQGRPVVVAADVTPMPDTVEGIRRSFDAAAWTPDRDLPVDVKKHRTREAAVEDDHQRDALAAALGAYDYHADKIEQVVAKTPARVDAGSVVARVVGDGQPVDEAVAAERDGSGDAATAGSSGADDADEGDGDTHEGDATADLSEEEAEIRRLREQVERLQGHVDDLEATVERRDETIASLEADLEHARSERTKDVERDETVQKLRRKIDQLEDDLAAERAAREDLDGKLTRLKALWKLDHDNFADVAEAQSGLVSVKVVDQFTTAAIDDADERFGLVEGDVIAFRDASGAGRSTAERLARIGPRLVLREGGLSEVADQVLFEHDVPVAPADDVTVQEVDELAVAREREVEAAIDDWEARARRRQRERNAEMVDRLISEYRAGESD